MTAARYVLHHEGTWFYYLGGVLRGDLSADGEPMEACERDGWWSCGHEASAITVTRRARDVVTGYRLTDPEAASARYPLILTAAEWAERRGVSDGEDDRLWHLYDRVTEPGEPVAEEIPGPWLRLAIVIEAASVAACSRCLGHGYVPSGSESYEKEKKP